ncbi:MAG: reverse gyrase [Epsilonproteobacteria bacterium]|nr:reverse gyrase [Campylobacterota bacterium]
MLLAVYKGGCVRCGGDISSIELETSGFCAKCQKELQQNDKKNLNCENLLHFEKYCLAKEKFLDFEAFFKKHTGSDLNPFQRYWAKRFFLGESFGMLADTGIGKSTFGLMLGAYLKSAYIILPTRLLVMQAYERIKDLASVAVYLGKKSQKDKIKSGDYDVLITTTQFLYKNRDIINRDFELVFVDDVDSIIKSAKKLDVVVSLLGFESEDVSKAVEAVRKKDYELLEKIKSKRKGTLLISSATAAAKSPKARILKYLFGFGVSKPNLSIRNVIDTYEENYNLARLAGWIKKLGRGGLVFLSSNETKERLNEVVEFLNAQGINAKSYEEFKDNADGFKRGEVVFVGFASYKNPLARGIDLGVYVRYTLFFGVPKLEFRLGEGYKSLYRLLLNIMPYMQELGFLDEDKTKIKEIGDFLKKYIYLKNPPQSVMQKIREYVLKAEDILNKYKDKIAQSEDIGFDGEKFIVGDISGYIQASGRASRFYKGHLTKGLGLVLVDNKKAFNSLNKKLRWFTNSTFTKINELDLQEILKEIDKSRQEEMKTSLKVSFVVVESPTKAKTISSFFAAPNISVIDGVNVYEVQTQKGVMVIAASVGHDFDLVKDEGVWGVKDKYIPVFEVLENKDKILNALNIKSSQVDEVIVASDPDREGERIAFDLRLNNLAFNKNIKRARFYEITKYAIKKAFDELEDVDLNLVAAQFFRRIVDRWVGFKISSYLQERLNNKNISAGRVQTPVLRWICERTDKLKETVIVSVYEIDGVRFEFEGVRDEDVIEVKLIDSGKKEFVFTPFNTPLFLKEAALKLKLSPQKCMQTAQELFEMGYITYHRTDSLKISSYAQEMAKEYITKKFSKEFVQTRSFESKGAHEAIRPTRAMDVMELKSFAELNNINLTQNHFTVYDLIFRRFIASQMRASVLRVDKFEVLGEVFEFITDIIKHGGDLVYEIEVKKIKEGIYTPKKEVFKKRKYSPYTYADIIEMMREKNIGRPSTYAITIQKLFERGYITEKNGYIFAKPLGFRVIKELENSKYSKFTKEEFSAELESVIDEIEKGRDYVSELKKVYEVLFNTDK